MTRKRSINKPENESISTPKLDELITESKKQYGGNVIKKAKNITPVSYIHTGIFAIDLATLGGFVDHQTSMVVGWESSMKTTISYRLIANAQKKYPDKKAVFLDAETHFDKEWASIQGVDVDNLLIVSDLGDGEYYRDVLDAVISTGETSIVVLDSIAALVPFDDINKSAKDEVKIGARAKLVGRIYSTIIHGKQELGKKGIKDPMIVLINQWRNTIAFMGDNKCLHGDSLINFVDGRSIKIKDVVENRISGKVWGIEINTNKITPVDIIDYHYNGKAEKGDFYTTTVESVETRNGIASLTSTKNHKHLTSNGWKKVEHLTRKDKLITKYKDVINGDVRDFLNGALCGDSHITCNKNQRNSFIKFQDSIDIDYMIWKSNLLKESLGGAVNKRNCYITNHMYCLTKLKNEYNGKRNPLRLLNNFSWLGFAIWLMDDAHLQNNKYYKLCIYRCRNKLDHISEKFNQMGLQNSISSNGVTINFDRKSSIEISKQISNFVPKCMKRKLLGNEPKGDSLYLNFNTEFKSEEINILSIEKSSDRKYRDKKMYDLSVSGDNAFLAGSSTNGFYTHNTLPGGNSQKFLSYLTFEGKKGKPVLPNAKKHPELHKVDKETVIAKSFKFKIIKTKSGMSHDNDEYEYVVSNKFPDKKVGDIDEITMIVNHAKKCGLLTGAGAGQKLCLYVNESFNSMGMIGIKLEKDPEKLELLKAMIVAIHRKNNGKSAIPSDGILMGVQGSKIIKAVENAGI